MKKGDIVLLDTTKPQAYFSSTGENYLLAPKNMITKAEVSGFYEEYAILMSTKDKGMRLPLGMAPIKSLKVIEES